MSVSRPLALFVLNACVSSTPARGAETPPPYVSMIATREPAKIASLLRDSVVNAGVWFPDPECRATFGVSGAVPAAQHADFARCLAMLDLRTTSRSDALKDVFVLEYAPGFELEARILEERSGPRLTFIGPVGRRDDADGLPTITAAAFAQLRKGPSGEVDPREAGTLLDEAKAAGEPAAYAWFKVCVDRSGNVTNVEPRMITSRHALLAFSAIANAWEVRPFLVDGAPLAVCAMVRVGAPRDVIATVPEVIPAPLPAGNTLLLPVRGLTRIAGEKLLVPDDDTKTEIQKSGVQRVTGTFRVCVAPDGAVESVDLLQSTRVPAYDRTIIDGIRRWRFRPYADEGGSLHACIAVTFVYSQR